jgi:hypothetical protein
MDLDERIRRQVRMLRTTRPRAPRPGSAVDVRPSAPEEPSADAETQVLPAAPRGRRDKRRT